MTFDREFREGRQWSGGGDAGFDPGKRPLTASLPRAQPQPSATPEAAAAPAASAAPMAMPDPFSLHLATSAPLSGGAGGGGGGEGDNVSVEADMIQEGTTGGDAAGGAGGQAGTGGQAAQGGGSGGQAAAGPLGEPSAAATEAGTSNAGEAGGAAGGAAGTGTGAAAAPTTLYIMGPRELWFFDGQTPAGYDVARPLRSNRTGGTFRWSASANLTISAAGDATPTVTSAAASTGRNDAWIRLSHTDASGRTTVASYRVTILAPNSLNHLRDDDGADATFVYRTFIHYSVLDQFGTVLPRTVPLNEQFTAAPTADFAGMDWRRGAEGGAVVNPADWADHVQGETPGHTPAPVAPGTAGAGTAVYHWPGIWRVGSTAIGSGRNVATVTWQKNRGFARHT